MGARARGRPTAGDPSAVSTEHLLDAALDAFAARGYEGMSVRELARGLGVSHNLIPQRIGSKEDLWRRAVDHGFARVAAGLADETSAAGPEAGTETSAAGPEAGTETSAAGPDAGADDAGPDDVARLRALVTRFVEENAARPALLRIISREAVAPGPRFDYLFDNYIDPVRIFGADLLARLEAAGRVRSGSVALLYFFMTHGAGGPLALPALAERFGDAVDPDDPAAVRRHARQAVAVLFDGLVVAPTGSRRP